MTRKAICIWSYNASTETLFFIEPIVSLIIFVFHAWVFFFFFVFLCSSRDWAE